MPPIAKVAQETSGMASALSALSNATVTFSVAGTGVVTDPTTGNVTPATSSITVSMFLKAERVRGATFPGVEVYETVFDGYALEALDEGITVGTNGVVTFAGQDPIECEVTALRLPYGKTGLLGSTLNAALGERIQLLSREQVG
jgi:hypothetical protein